VPVEVVTWRVSAFAPEPAVSLAVAGDLTTAPTPKAHRPVRFQRGMDPVDTPVFDRHELGVGTKLAGPALVEERETTAVLRPGWEATVTSDGSIVAAPVLAPELRAITRQGDARTEGEGRP
jgi:N-methylhydantoinase A